MAAKARLLLRRRPRPTQPRCVGRWERRPPLPSFLCRHRPLSFSSAQVPSVRGLDASVAAWLRASALAPASSHSGAPHCSPRRRRRRLDLHALLLDPWAVLRPLLTTERTAALLPLAATLRVEPDSLHAHLARRLGGGVLRFAVVRGAAAVAAAQGADAAAAYAAVAAGVEAHLRALLDALGAVRDTATAAETAAAIVAQSLAWGSGSSSSSSSGGLQWVSDLVAAHRHHHGASGGLLPASGAAPPALAPDALLSLSRLLLSVRLRLLLVALWFGQAHATALLHVAAALQGGRSGGADVPLAELLAQLSPAGAAALEAAAAVAVGPTAAAAVAFGAEPFAAPAAAAAAAAADPPDGRDLWRRLILGTVALPGGGGHPITDERLVEALLSGGGSWGGGGNGWGAAHSSSPLLQQQPLQASPPAPVASLAELSAPGGIDASLYADEAQGGGDESEAATAGGAEEAAGGPSLAASAAAFTASLGRTPLLHTPRGGGSSGTGSAFPGLARRMARTAAALRALRAAWVGCVSLGDLAALGPADAALLAPFLVAGRVRDFAAFALHRRGAAAAEAAATAAAALDEVAEGEVAATAAATPAPDSVDAFVAAAAGPWLPAPPAGSAAAPGVHALYRVVATVAWRHGLDLPGLLRQLVGRWLLEDPPPPPPAPQQKTAAAAAAAAALPAYFAPTAAEAAAAAEEAVLAKLLFALSPPEGLPAAAPPQPPPPLLLDGASQQAAAVVAGSSTSPARRPPPRPPLASFGTPEPPMPPAPEPPLPPAAPQSLAQRLRAEAPGWLLAEAESAAAPPAPAAAGAAGSSSSGGSGGGTAGQRLRTRARALLALMRLLPPGPLAALLAGPRPPSSSSSASPPAPLLRTPAAACAAFLSASHLGALAALRVTLGEAEFAACSKAALVRGLWRDFQGHAPALLAAARLLLDYRVADTGLWGSLLSSLADGGCGREGLQLLLAAVRPGSSGSGGSSGGSGSLLLDRCGPALARVEEPAFAHAARGLLWGPLVALGAPLPLGGGGGGSTSSGPAAGGGLVGSAWPPAPATLADPSVLAALGFSTRALLAFPAPQLLDAPAFAWRLAELAAAAAAAAAAGGSAGAVVAAAAEIAAFARAAAAAHPSAKERAGAAARVEDVLQQLHL